MFQLHQIHKRARAYMAAWQHITIFFEIDFIRGLVPPRHRFECMFILINIFWFGLEHISIIKTISLFYLMAHTIWYASDHLHKWDCLYTTIHMHIFRFSMSSGRQTDNVGSKNGKRQTQRLSSLFERIDRHEWEQKSKKKKNREKTECIS